MSDGIAMRPLRREDIPPVVDLIVRTLDTCYPSSYPPAIVEFFKHYHAPDLVEQDAAEGYTVVVELDGRIVATGTLVGDHVKRVFIDPSAQRRGLGRAIMGHLEARARENGQSALTLDASLPAKEFYDRLGYDTLKVAFVMVRGGEIMEEEGAPGTTRLDYYEMGRTL